MNQTTQDTLMQHIDKRLTVVEQYIRAREEYEKDDRKWIRGLVLAFLVQFLTLIGAGIIGAIEIGRLVERLESIDVVQLRGQASTALQVLADHGEEIESVRNEQFRLRGNIDQLRAEMAAKTDDRFYKSDAILLENRVTRIENILLNGKRNGSKP